MCIPYFKNISLLRYTNPHLSLQWVRNFLVVITSKITVTDQYNNTVNIIIMMKFDILLELPKCDTETQYEQILWGRKRCQLTYSMQSYHKASIKKDSNTASMKHSKAEHSETRHACKLYWPHFFISIIHLRYLKIKPTSGS